MAVHALGRDKLPVNTRSGEIAERTRPAENQRNGLIFVPLRSHHIQDHQKVTEILPDVNNEVGRTTPDREVILRAIALHASYRPAIDSVVAYGETYLVTDRIYAAKPGDTAVVQASITL